MDEFEPVLHEYLRIASKNNFVLPKSCGMTLAKTRDRFGPRAVEQFREWFEASRRFDHERADFLRAALLRGDYKDPPKSWPDPTGRGYNPGNYFEYLRKNTCFTSMWAVKPELWQAAYDKVTPPL